VAPQAAVIMMTAFGTAEVTSGRDQLVRGPSASMHDMAVLVRQVPHRHVHRPK
jgi:hypothetical protein